VSQNNEIPQGFRMTELGALPEEWEVVRLGDVAEYINGYAFKPTQWNTKGLPIIRIQNLTNTTDKINYFDGELDERYKVRAGDLLISWSASLGVFKWNNGDAWLNQHIFKVDNYNQKIWKDYFYYIIMTQIEVMKTKTHGSTMHHITKKEFLNIRIPLPPLAEQRRIAAVLSAIQQAKEKTEQVIAAARELKKSLMHHLFTYGVVSLKEAEKVKLKDTEIGKIPEEWEVKPLVDIATLQRGKDLPKQKQVPGLFPIVGSSGIIGYHNKYICVGPGVVTGRSGSIGKLTYVEKNYWPHNTGLYVKDFHGNNPKFVYYLLHLLDFKKYATPLSEQQKIASILSAVDEKIQAEENKKKALEGLFKSMLYNLMTAKIRVNHLDVVDYGCD
jgi:type I restriction enzyme S subunit